MADRIKQISIARRYAQAVFELLSEAERRSLAAECGELSKALRSTPEAAELLRSAVIGTEEKLSVLLKTLPQAAKINAVKDFLAILCQKKREEILPAFCDCFEEMVHQADGKAKCVLTFARDVSGGVVDSIRQTLGKKLKKELVVETRVDPTLLGGFTAEIQGTFLDASMRTELNGLKNHIVNSVSR